MPNMLITLLRRGLRLAIALLLPALLGIGPARASSTSLADQPLFSTNSVPGNLLLSLSVEFPTAISVANYQGYSPSSTFYGYFDPNKCYTYYYNSSDTNSPYFAPYGATDSSHRCTSTVNVSYTAHYFILSLLYLGSTTPVVDPSTSTQLWSGNYLNWATMQTIDPFRSTLTGGYRAVDTSSLTVLEKAYGSSQGSISNFPDRTLSNANTITSTYGASSFSASSCNNKSANGGSGLAMPGFFPLIAVNVYICQQFKVVGTTPFPLSSIDTRIWSQGNHILFTNANGSDTNWGASTTTYQPSVYVGDSLPPVILPFGVTNSTEYAAQVRVKVCDPSVGLESNCTKYGSNYKPEGLMQKYAMSMRFGAFGYLNDSATSRDGGVLRARMSYIGPTKPVPASGTTTTNSNAEWDSTTGVFITNPDSADATATTSLTGVTVSNSGVMNYLNKFGEASGQYKTYDPVSELYYAGIRYFKNQGNVTSYSNSLNSTMIDGFPVITSWDDPIQYACQQNFVLGIGDINTHYDANLPGSTLRSSYEPSLPAEVSADNTVNVATATNKIGSMEPSMFGVSNYSTLGSTYQNSSSGSLNTYYIAGLAYDSHTVDMRPSDFRTSDNLDANGNKIFTQTASTYWLDVMEYQQYSYQNPYWMAAKYGGFTVPSGFSPYAPTTTSIGSDWSGGTTDAGYPGVTTAKAKPANYFSAADPLSMSTGLTKAFLSIASKISAGSSQLNVSTLQLTSSGNQTYAASYIASNWTGDVIAYLTSFDSSGNPSSTELWSARDKLESQAAGTGWNTNRIIATSSPSNSSASGVPFRYANLSSSQLSTLGSTATDQQNMLNFLRGDQSNEGGSGTGAYRQRDYADGYLLGDIVDSRVAVVGSPNAGYSDSTNPGYSTFRSSNASRPQTIYVGANDGMLHAFDGTTTGGSERFAYVPSALLPGPNNTPSTDGLAALGAKSFVHHYYVDATPVATDVDFNNAAGTTTSTHDWHSLLVGGLGKGGKSFYALDVTSPQSITTEATLASKVLWEFTSSTMGYSYGNPVVVKTKKYGWVVMLTSGYNSSDGIGRLYLVNPKTGALLETLSTGTGSLSSPAGLTYASGFVIDYSDYTVDAVYAGDLLGNLWRFDMTAASGGYPAPVKLATLTAADGTPQPITTRPLIEVDPNTQKRYVMVGTGRLLSTTDINNSQVQTFYAIVDGNRGAFNSSGSFPIQRSNLTANTNLTTGLTSSATYGWYYDLPHSTTGSLGTPVTERVNLMATANSGIVAWAGNLPSGSVCNASGSYYVYAVNFATGKSVLTGTVSGEGAVTDLSFVNVGGTVRLEAGLDNKSAVNVPGNFSSGAKFVNLNWREVPTPD